MKENILGKEREERRKYQK